MPEFVSSLTPSAARGWADAVLVLHAVFIAWAVLGVFAVWRWPRLAWLHLPAVAWAVWITATSGICPLTPLEWALRERAGQGGQGGGFIEHYLMRAIYPEGLTPQIQQVMAAVLLAANLAVYGRLVSPWFRQKKP
jgi:hypothetical protein